jgi:hypothetical protein
MGLREDAPENNAKPAIVGRKVGIKNSSFPLIPTYDNEIELVQFIASEMQKEGLDLNKTI